jgi:glycosyl transferase family 21
VPTFIGGVALLAPPGIEDPRSSEALGAGAFLMVRASVFRAIGGFESIRGEMGDDRALARLVKSKGYRVGLRFAPDFLHVRLYKGNRHAFWAMTKNVLIAIEGRLWLAPAVMVLPMFAFWTPLYCAIAGVVESDVALAVVGAAGYVIPYASMWSGRRIFPHHPLKALCYPLVAIPVFCCMARAVYLYLIRGEVAWRGRSIRVRESQPG